MERHQSRGLAQSVSRRDFGRHAGAAATLSLSPLADAARGFQRSAREMTETDRAERRAALLSLTDATLRAQGPDARATQAEAG
jgi:hypothetical protein